MCVSSHFGYFVEGNARNGATVTAVPMFVRVATICPLLTTLSSEAGDLESRDPVLEQKDLELRLLNKNYWGKGIRAKTSRA